MSKFNRGWSRDSQSRENLGGQSIGTREIRVGSSDSGDFKKRVSWTGENDFQKYQNVDNSAAVKKVPVSTTNSLDYSEDGAQQRGAVPDQFRTLERNKHIGTEIPANISLYNTPGKQEQYSVPGQYSKYPYADRNLYPVLEEVLRSGNPKPTQFPTAFDSDRVPDESERIYRARGSLMDFMSSVAGTAEKLDAALGLLNQMHWTERSSSFGEKSPFPQESQDLALASPSSNSRRQSHGFEQLKKLVELNVLRLAEEIKDLNSVLKGSPKKRKEDDIESTTHLLEKVILILKTIKKRGKDDPQSEYLNKRFALLIEKFNQFLDSEDGTNRTQLQKDVYKQVESLATFMRLPVEEKQHSRDNVSQESREANKAYDERKTQKLQSTPYRSVQTSMENLNREMQQLTEALQKSRARQKQQQQVLLTEERKALYQGITELSKHVKGMTTALHSPEIASSVSGADSERIGSEGHSVTELTDTVDQLSRQLELLGKELNDKQSETSSEGGKDVITPETRKKRYKSGMSDVQFRKMNDIQQNINSLSNSMSALRKRLNER